MVTHAWPVMWLCSSSSHFRIPNHWWISYAIFELGVSSSLNWDSKVGLCVMGLALWRRSFHFLLIYFSTYVLCKIDALTHLWYFDFLNKSISLKIFILHYIPSSTGYGKAKRMNESLEAPTLMWVRLPLAHKSPNIHVKIICVFITDLTVIVVKRSVRMFRLEADLGSCKGYRYKVAYSLSKRQSVRGPA